MICWIKVIKCMRSGRNLTLFNLKLLIIWLFCLSKLWVTINLEFTKKETILKGKNKGSA